MYQALLTRRYLLSKVMPLLASAAVMLCTAMVLVVWSVMGGFLNMLLASGKSMIGDVSITWPVVGIPHYEALIDRLQADPMVHSATPLIEALGLVKFPTEDVKAMTVFGVEPEGYSRVTGYADRLWWRPLETPMRKDSQRQDPRLGHPNAMGAYLDDGLRLSELDPGTGARRPAAALGLHAYPGNNRRDRAGFVVPRMDFGPEIEVTLSVLPLSKSGTVLDQRSIRLPVANEFRTGMYEADANWIVVPLAELQRLLKMDRAERVGGAADLGTVIVGEDGQERFAVPQPVAEEPARATTILIRAREGVTADALRARVETLYEAFEKDMTSAGKRVPPTGRVPIFTWENKPGLATFIQAVKKETALVLVLFGFISFTAVFLVFAIFWSMISEKTKDIGVLRALGASRSGVAWLFTRYGLAIGVVGATMGLALASAVVWNINPIHEWMGEALGIQVWDPSVYYFTEIPSQVVPWKAGLVWAIGVMSSVLGALIPAARAAAMDPVRALRFE
ncbi:MAG TPA: hypothetical protein DEB06_07350 [Phycisphaerales bacterium]|nr:hypothetical protein [Phycisphaerales bacterium]